MLKLCQNQHRAITHDEFECPLCVALRLNAGYRDVFNNISVAVELERAEVQGETLK